MMSLLIFLPCVSSSSLAATASPSKEVMAEVDVGRVCGNSTIDEKYEISRHHFKPGPNFRFPVTNYAGMSRTFQISSLEKYHGLVYSSSRQGAFGVYCCLFGEHGLGQLVTKPMTHMVHAHQNLAEHFGTKEKAGKKSHLNAKERALTFLQLMESKRPDVHSQMCTGVAERIEKNRQIVKSLMKCILICGRQNLDLRGLRDDSQYLNGKTNPGNFQSLVDFRVDAGDQDLINNFTSSGKNCTYRSKTIQNEKIDVLKDYITAKLSGEVRVAGAFSVIADEKTDHANEEQLGVCLRFIGKESYNNNS